MPEARTEERKLTAIMFTDMVGYSALSQRNEALVLEILQEHHHLLRALFDTHRGQEIKTTGDGFLVTFASALEAACCAIDIQKAVAQHNALASPERRFRLRIGIHVGDVVYREGDVIGDSVNIAERIQTLAPAECICLSRPVFDQIQNKIAEPMVSLGRPKLKNIQAPVEVFRIAVPWGHGGSSTTEGDLNRRVYKRTYRIALAVLAAMSGAAGWWLYSHQIGLRNVIAPGKRPLSARGTRAEAAESIAVLPFLNMGPNHTDEYLSDGVTEEIINALAKVSGLRVTARTSAFVFKGRNEDVRRIGEQLNVRTLLEGSVQKSGARLRITAQLINAADGYHLWSERYDRAIKDLFAVEDEISQTIAGALKVKLAARQSTPKVERHTENLEAHSLYLQGRYFWNKRTEEGTKKAIYYFNQAIEKDPNYAEAYAGLADAYNIQTAYRSVPPSESAPRAKYAATKALQLDESLAEPHTSLALLADVYDWDWLRAEREYKRAIALNPSYPTAHHWYSMYLMQMGRTGEALAEIRRAQQADPLSQPINCDWGRNLYLARRYDQAIEHLRKALEIDPRFVMAHVWLGLAYLHKSMPSEAITELQQARELSRDRPIPLAALGYACALVGRRAEARRLLEELRQRSKQSYVPGYFVAALSLGLGERDRAIEWLATGFKQRDGYEVLLVTRDPAFDSLRSDPRFVALLRKVGLPC